MEKQMEVTSANRSQAAITSRAYAPSDMLQLHCHNQASFIQFQDHLGALMQQNVTDSDWR